MFVAGLTLKVRLHRMIFLMRYLAVHFMLPVKKLRFSFEVVWCRGYLGGKTPPNGFLQAIQEMWYRERRVMGLNIPDYTLFCASGVDRPRVCILATNMNIRILPGFSCRDLLAVLRNYNEGEAARRLVVCSAFFL